jgi:2-phospho-L-lactate guanylyltransferase
MTARATWAVVPVKDFGTAKRRLAPLLSAVDRRMLSQAMLEDVLTALAAAGGLAGILVVTCDLRAKALAEKYGADVLWEAANLGVNAAVAAGARALAAREDSAMLFVPGDVPLVTAPEIGRILDGTDAGPAVSIVPARAGGGTNALYCAPPEAIEFRFGEDSFQRHLSAARAHGLAPRVIDSPALGLDIDKPADIRALLRASPATRASRCLDELGAAGRLVAARGLQPLDTGGDALRGQG